ncbi:hypothetical protein HNV12_16080 [Methanococcoides sp. SA1]|nr:hypothetical protein [Methanococcoides sp. SA1]
MANLKELDRVRFVDIKKYTGLTYVKNIDEKIEEHAKLFGYSTFEISGNQKIFENCYLSIKIN